MTVQKEIESAGGAPSEAPQSSEVTHIPESPDISQQLQEAGVVSSTPQPTPLTDDNGQTLIHPAGDDPASGPVVLPADPATVTSWTKGSANNSKTWLGVLLERLKLIAWHTGRKVVYNRPQN